MLVDKLKQVVLYKSNRRTIPDNCKRRSNSRRSTHRADYKIALRKTVCLAVNTAALFASVTMRDATRRDARVDHVEIRFAGPTELFGSSRLARKRIK